MASGDMISCCGDPTHSACSTSFQVGVHCSHLEGCGSSDNQETCTYISPVMMQVYADVSTVPTACLIRALENAASDSEGSNLQAVQEHFIELLRRTDLYTMYEVHQRGFEDTILTCHAMITRPRADMTPTSPAWVDTELIDAIAAFSGENSSLL